MGNYCSKSRPELVQMLLEKGISPNVVNKHGFSPLYVACGSGYEPIVEILFADIKINPIMIKIV